MTTAGRLCKRPVVVATRGEPLIDAARRMRDEHVGCLVVIEGRPDGARRPVGVLTDRDIVVQVLARTDRHLDGVTVGDVVGDQKLVFAFAGDDLAEAIDRMRAAGVRRLPVLDPRGELEGILTLDDLFRAVSGSASNLAALIAEEQKRERGQGP